MGEGDGVRPREGRVLGKLEQQVRLDLAVLLDEEVAEDAPERLHHGCTGRRGDLQRPRSAARPPVRMKGAIQPIRNKKK